MSEEVPSDAVPTDAPATEPADKRGPHDRDDPHSQLVETLRSQIDDLTSQVTLLNGKVVLLNCFLPMRSWKLIVFLPCLACTVL